MRYRNADFSISTNHNSKIKRIYHKIQNIKLIIIIYIFLQLHPSPFEFLVILLNKAADETLIKSDILFHNGLPRNFIESMPNIMLFVAGFCGKSLFLMSYLMSSLVK